MVAFSKILKNVQVTYDVKKQHVPVVAFTAGLAFDAFSLKSFDNWITIA